MPSNDIMTVKELAGFLKIAEKTAYRFASEGKVLGFKWAAHGVFGKVKLTAGSQNKNKMSEKENDGQRTAQ